MINKPNKKTPNSLELIPDISYDTIPEGKMQLMQRSDSVAQLLNTLPSLEYEVLLLASKGLSSQRITKYIMEIIEDIDEPYFLDKNIENISNTEMEYGIEEFLHKGEIKDYLLFLKESTSNKTYRKLQLETITFEVYSTIIKKIKKGEIENWTINQLISLSDKMLKSLHLEEDRNKEITMDGIKIIANHYKNININPIITSEEGFNFLDVKYFGDKLSNKTPFTKPEDAEIITHDD